MKSGEFRRILWRDNPLLVYLVGLCPALAVSDRLSNALLRRCEGDERSL